MISPKFLQKQKIVGRETSELKNLNFLQEQYFFKITKNWRKSISESSCYWSWLTFTPSRQQNLNFIAALTQYSFSTL
jgi:hypothetical protein